MLVVRQVWGLDTKRSCQEVGSARISLSPMHVQKASLASHTDCRKEMTFLVHHSVHFVDLGRMT